MIAFERVGKAYGATPVIAELSLVIEKGEFFVLVGGSGAGKSTVLKLINRLIPADAGTIRFDGQAVTAFRPEDLRRRMGYVIQSIGLFPHWTVARNIAAVPAMLGWAPARRQARTAELMAALNLDAALGERLPHQLSIGQQQRVGIARALAADPEVLLMDEPFGALDPVNRDALQTEMARLHRASGKTIVLVTHDMDEALRLGTRIGVLGGGRLLQAGTPEEILRRPADPAVARLFGPEEAGIRLLGLETVASRLRPAADAACLPIPADAACHPIAADAAGPPIAAEATLRQALSRMITERRDRLAVSGPSGEPMGTIHLADLL